MILEKIELTGSVDIEKDVMKKVRNVGVKGMDVEKAKELGFFERISNLLCASHCGVMAAYRIYNGASSIISEFGARRNDIAKAMNEYEKAFMKFVSFWTDYYANGESGVDVNYASENLYRRMMKWSCLPEQWRLGDPQRTESEGCTAMKVVIGDSTYYFNTTSVESESEDCGNEYWCVTKCSLNEEKQETVNTGMDKASAIMVAKRLSSEDNESIYTASVVHELKETKTVVTPFRAFMNNETIGNITTVERM